MFYLYIFYFALKGNRSYRSLSWEISVLYAENHCASLLGILTKISHLPMNICNHKALFILVDKYLGCLQALGIFSTYAYSSKITKGILRTSALVFPNGSHRGAVTDGMDLSVNGRC